MSRLKTTFEKEIVAKLMSKLSLKNRHDVPKFEKIILNMGLGEDASDGKKLKSCADDMALIAGQKPIKTFARKSVASFKIREGFPIGCKVTLRGEKMYDFFERLVNLAIPREKDFRGLSVKSFDGRGNYNMGIKEQIIFPEIDYDKVDKLRGMDIAITTSATKDSDAKELLESFNFPFRGKNG